MCVEKLEQRRKRSAKVFRNFAKLWKNHDGDKGRNDHGGWTEDDEQDDYIVDEFQRTRGAGGQRFAAGRQDRGESVGVFPCLQHRDHPRWQKSRHTSECFTEAQPIAKIFCQLLKTATEGMIAAIGNFHDDLLGTVTFTNSAFQ